jgi:hypothetical protein
MTDTESPRAVVCHQAQIGLAQIGKSVDGSVSRVWLERMGNMLLWEAPDKITTLICKFIQSVHAAGNSRPEHYLY